MIEKTIFSRFLKNKRLVFLVFIFLGFFLPLNHALAQLTLVKNLLGSVLSLPSYFLSGPLVILTIISGLLSAAAGGWLFLVTSNEFFLNETSYTHNSVVEVGLSVTQGFANMVLVLVLVFIALAVILQLREYEAKKLLPTFIIVALLVNFAPLVTGLVVDASNIIMNYFLNKGAGYNAVINGLISVGDGLVSTVGLFFTTPLSPQVSTNALYMVLLIANNFLMFLILTIFSFIFIARHLAIWLLTILSPLAFALYVLPSTRGLAQMWWKQLIHWSFVGVGCAFFLYLSGFFINSLNVAGGLTILWKSTDDILPYLISTAFLYIGLIFGLKTSAIGAGAIIGYTTAKGVTLGKWAREKTWKGLNLPERKWLPSFGRKGLRPSFKGFVSPKEATGWTVRQWERIPILRALRPETARIFADFKPAVDAAKKNITGPSDIEIDRVAKGVYSGTKAAAALDSIVRDRGDSQDVIKAYKRKYKIREDAPDEELFQNEKFLKDKTLLNALRIIGHTGNLGKIYRTDPRLTKIGKTQEEGRRTLIKAIDDAKPGDIANWEREVIENKEIIEAFIAIRKEEDFRTIGRLKGGVLGRQQSINRFFSEYVYNNGLDPKNNEDNWKKYLEDIARRHGVKETGYERALRNERFTSSGWDIGQYGDYPDGPPSGPPTPTPPGGPAPSPGPSGFTGPGAGPTAPPPGGPSTTPPPPSGGPARGGFSGPGTAPPPGTTPPGPAMGMGNIPTPPPPSGRPATPPPPSGGPGRGGFFGPGTTPPGPGAQTTTKTQQDALKSVLKDIGLTDEEIEKIKSRSDLNKITGLKKVQDKAVDILKKHKVKDRQIRSMGVKKAVLKAIEILVKEKIDQMNKNK